MRSRPFVSLAVLVVFALLAAACPEEGPGEPVTAIADCGQEGLAEELAAALRPLVDEFKIDSPDYRFGEVICGPPSSSFSIERIQFALVPMDDTGLVDTVNGLKGLDSLKLSLEANLCDGTWGFYSAADSRTINIEPIAEAIEASQQLEEAIGC